MPKLGHIYIYIYIYIYTHTHTHTHTHTYMYINHYLFFLTGLRTWQNKSGNYNFVSILPT